MRTLLNNLMRGEKHSTERYIYHDLTIEDQEKQWAERTIVDKKKGIPLKKIIEQSMLWLDEAEITINAKHYSPIRKTQLQLEKVRNDTTEVKESYEDYVESEKKVIPDEQYEEIDLLETKLRRMQNQASERDEINSEFKNQEVNEEKLNDQDHEG